MRLFRRFPVCGSHVDDSKPKEQAWRNEAIDGYTAFTELVLGERVAEAHFGEVRRATHRGTGARFAIKTASTVGEDSWHSQLVRREGALLSRLSHPSIVVLVAIEERPEAVHIVLECFAGDFLDRLSEMEYSEKEARTAAKSLLEGVAYLHEQRVVHREIKPENLSFKGHRLVITDFSLACSMDNKEFLTKRVGTEEYMSPEVQVRKRYGGEVDLWSSGVVIYCLACGYLPWGTSNKHKMRAAIRTGAVDFEDDDWAAVSSELRHLIRRLIEVCPVKRLSARAALRHPWFALGDDAVAAVSLENATTHVRETLHMSQLMYAPDDGMTPVSDPGSPSGDFQEVMTGPPVVTRYTALVGRDELLTFRRNQERESRSPVILNLPTERFREKPQVFSIDCASASASDDDVDDRRKRTADILRASDTKSARTDDIRDTFTEDGRDSCN